MYFYLKEPSGDKDTIIIIQYYIADEKKIFKYSTGETINPNDWERTRWRKTSENHYLYNAISRFPYNSH